jgi:hypothetical protein
MPVRNDESHRENITVLALTSKQNPNPLSKKLERNTGNGKAGI